MPRETRKAPRRSLDPKELRRYLPDPKLVQREVDRHARLVLSAMMSPSMVMAGMKALTSFRHAIEEGLKHGPQDLRVQVSVREAEKALLTAVQEAASAMLLEIGETPPPTAPKGEGGEGPQDEGGLVEVQVDRAAERSTPHVLPRTRPARRAKVARKRRA